MAKKVVISSRACAKFFITSGLACDNGGSGKGCHVALRGRSRIILATSTLQAFKLQGTRSNHARQPEYLGYGRTEWVIFVGNIQNILELRNLLAQARIRRAEKGDIFIA